MPRKIATGNKVKTLYSSIRQIIDEARSKVYRTANFTMVQAYWQIGKLIVEEEQKGKGRAEYGEELIEKLSVRLSLDYGKGFNSTNLWYMRQFYTKFEKLHALRGELSWTHYRLLLKVEREDAKDFYLQESIDGNWRIKNIFLPKNNWFRR